MWVSEKPFGTSFAAAGETNPVERMIFVIVIMVRVLDV
jgi:hypothetical protein